VKRPSSPGAEQQPPSGAKKQRTEEESDTLADLPVFQPRRSRRLQGLGSESTGPSAFSPRSISEAQTETTVPDILKEEMAEHTADFEGYYYGLPGQPKLLARSNPEPWIAPSFEVTAGHSPPTKALFVVTHHPLREKLDAGLRDKIRSVLATMSPCRWISVDYLRIGYDRNVAQNNPVVVVITVEKDQVPPAEAQRIVNDIAEECRV
jgi:hypothetical protein